MFNQSSHNLCSCFDALWERQAQCCVGNYKDANVSNPDTLEDLVACVFCPGARGDVHFSGFLGQEFCVYGIDKRWFSVFSDANIAVNAELAFARSNVDFDGSIMKRVAIVGPGGRKWLLEFYEDDEASSFTVSPAVTAAGERRWHFGECGHAAWTSDSTMEVAIAGYKLTLARQTWTGPSGSRDHFIDIDLAIPNASAAASGFLGETLHKLENAPFPVRGEEADYLVRCVQ